MRFAVGIPNFGDFADPRLVADLARRAEEAGWDGLFVWDHITHRKELRRDRGRVGPADRRRAGDADHPADHVQAAPGQEVTDNWFA